MTASSHLIENTIQLLTKMYDNDRGLFSYTSILMTDRVINNFNHPSSIRYTINVLAGLQKVKVQIEPQWSFDTLLDKFLSIHLTAVTDLANKGLLLYVLAEADHDIQHEVYKDLCGIIKTSNVLMSLTQQEIAWILLGLTKYAEINGSSGYHSEANRIYQFMIKHFMNQQTLLPYHTTHLWRKPFVSFGAIVYFLKAVYEYSRVFKDDKAQRLFTQSCTGVMYLQGHHGEWPWFINAHSAKVLDWYPVYSVHQDSMAMLFLLPALDLGLLNAKKSIEKSYRWLFGQNEMHKKMINDQPFFIYRSITRNVNHQKQRRFINSTLLAALRREARPGEVTKLSINQECRSYHLGWILYVWGQRNDFSEFTRWNKETRHATTVSQRGA